MRATGIIRRIDFAGRLVLPPDLCDSLHIERGNDALEIFVDEDKIVLRKYAPACAFCGSFDDLVEYNNVKICKDCVDKISELKK